MEFYHITDEYLNYLRDKGDKYVPYNKAEGKQRPYIGIITTINDFQYFIPLHSPKEHQGRFQDRVTDKILDPDDNTKLLGYLKYNNLIPVKESEYTKVDFESIKSMDTKYYSLIEKERKYLQNKVEKIQKKAQLVHRKFLSDKPEDDFYKRCCLNFVKLEECCLNYPGVNPVEK